MKTIAVASNNAGKIREIQQIFSGYRLMTMAELGVVSAPEETGNSFLENALIKAKALYELIKLPVLADDSGLEVEALNGAPGIYSARYGGVDTSDARNTARLIEEMAGKSDRRARFVCTVVLYLGGDDYLTAEGRAEGVILTAPRGAGGFGYDPVFYSDELHKSFAEAEASEKNLVSHRGRALRALAAKLAALEAAK